jgi:hypothetical protein
MKKMLNTFIAVFLLTACYCTGQLTGGGTETTNGISGVVACSTDTEAVNAVIITAIYSVDYRPDIGIGVAETILVDIGGTFKFDPPTEKRYNLFAWDTVNCKGAYLPMLPADTALGSITLTKTGTIVPDIRLPVSGTDTVITLIIPGSPFFLRTRSEAAISIPYVPEGTYTIIPDHPLTEYKVDLPVFTGKTFTIDPEMPDTVKITIP